MTAERFAAVVLVETLLAIMSLWAARRAFHAARAADPRR
jgi:hypothetical protein